MFLYIVQMQKTWKNYVMQVKELCTSEFWDTLRVLHTQKATVVNQILKKMYKTLQRTDLPSGHRWSTSIRSLNKRIIAKTGWFWDNVVQNRTIDLSTFQLPGVDSIKFNFVDPVFVWIMQCEKLVDTGNILVWRPTALKNPSGEEIYGAGIQDGLLFRAADQSVPSGGHVALMNLSWDGGVTGVGERSACPICIQVMNTNCAHKDTVGLVAYLPVLEVSASLKETDAYDDASFHILQECIKYIVERIETLAKHGFTCWLNGVKRLLFPRLGAMSLDSKERTKYFGQRSHRACSFCRLRNGRSIFRGSRRQDPDIMNLLFRWANSDAHTRVTISQRAQARATLLRHGWKYKRRCRLLDVARTCLVHVPQFPPTPFGGLCHFERMHTFFIAYCDYAMELLTALVLPSMKHKVQEYVNACHNFRDPITGVAHPRLTHVLNMVNLTAEKRVRAIFYWAHVLGPDANVIVRVMRTPALVAVSTLQLILIATRGHRAYNRQELHTIYLEVGQQFFSVLETMAEYVDAQRILTGAKAHARNPTRNHPPRPFKRMKRCVVSNLYSKTQICIPKHKFAFQNTNTNC